MLLVALLLPYPAFATTYIVNSSLNTPDTNPGDNVCEATTAGVQCTLMAAIEEANAHAGYDIINFSIGPVTINVTPNPLPIIVDRLMIDGTTAPGYAAAETVVTNAPPSVYIDGANLLNLPQGIRIENGQPLMRILGLGITNFVGGGIMVINTDEVDIDSNWIGITRTGGAAGNGAYVGGVVGVGGGIELDDCGSCRVGQDIDTTGPSLVGRGNVISSNVPWGVRISSGSTGTAIEGNHIGIDPVNGLDRGNDEDGISLFASGVRVGDARSGLRTPNYIAHNNGSGIRSSNVNDHRINSNEIYNNSGSGIALLGIGHQVGSTSTTSGNRIYNNGGAGVSISGVGTASNVVQRNYIYLNDSHGVRIANSATGNEVKLNYIFDNSDNGIHLESFVSSNTVSDNFIGLENATIKGNGANGVVVAAGGNTFTNNTIADVNDDGIDVLSGSGNQFTGNRIGVGVGGLDYGNGANGIRVRAAASNTSITSNNIGYNTLDGIRLEGSGSNVCGNTIGLGAALEAAGNQGNGVRISGSDNRLGGTDLCASNDIGQNVAHGVEVSGASNTLQDNFIGQKGVTLFGNDSTGVFLTSTANQNVVIDNVIGSNAFDAIRLAANAGTGNRIQGNNYLLNGTTDGDLAIDILDDGATANDADDADTGPNITQNTPELLAVVASPGQLEITYRMTSSISNSTYPITVDFYRGSEVSLGPGVSKAVEGEFVFRNVYNLAPNTSKVVTFNPTSMNGLGTIQAMATDAQGNTSEFSARVAFNLNDQPEEVFQDGFEDP